jgi:hypothetical protein
LHFIAGAPAAYGDIVGKQSVDAEHRAPVESVLDVVGRVNGHRHLAWDLLKLPQPVPVISYRSR